MSHNSILKLPKKQNVEMKQTMNKKWIIACAFFCGLLSIFLASALAQNARQQRVSDVELIKVGKGLLTVKLREAELASVLKEISRQAGMKIQIDELGEEQITMEFTGIPLGEGIKKLLQGKGWMMVFDRVTTPGLTENYQLKEISVFHKGRVPSTPDQRYLSDWKTYRNGRYGFEIKYPKSLVEYGEGEVRFPLGADNVSVLVDEKSSVLLSGTYGGRYPFEEYPNTRVSSNRVLSQRVVLNDIVFQRDYWVVYGGMGNWDSVINYYTKHNDNYYMISWEYTSREDIPGMLTNSGRKITQEEVANRILGKMMSDTEYVRTFNQMFLTFRFLD